ncbi:hypothetical protein B0H17DRAFT_1132677 [Mycena rosella]|uniref:Uncharacterized protein n=1 Tax=Mycena rosella TaxID=1033263 RepID=A0AAD7GKF9_MYCRO|nr:hypothetical protein B0H17DRAFT_1132677 [Mycena rosella]
MAILKTRDFQAVSRTLGRTAIDVLNRKSDQNRCQDRTRIGGRALTPDENPLCWGLLGSAQICCGKTTERTADASGAERRNEDMVDALLSTFDLYMLTAAQNPRLIAYPRAAEALAEGAAPRRRASAILATVAERGDATATIARFVVRGGGRMDEELGRAMHGRKMLGFCALGQKMAADIVEEK